VSLCSAEASSEPAPYSLAMLTHDYAIANTYLGIWKEDFELLAGDISREVLSRATAGE
jgi:chemotaxis methyl-accepting protein methylase